MPGAYSVCLWNVVVLARVVAGANQHVIHMSNGFLPMLEELVAPE